MFNFEHPYLFFLIFLPLVMNFFPKRDDGVIEVSNPHIARLKAAFSGKNKSTQASSSWYKNLLWFSWIFLVLALMQPQTIDPTKRVNNKGYDLMLAVDLSVSMKALDLSTKEKIMNRLDVVKNVLGDFIRRREGDRIGLILFGETAYLQSPLTLDNNSIAEMLNNTAIGMAGNTTAIGNAIGLAVKNLRERPEGSRVLILLTDGENTSGDVDPITAAKIAKQHNIRIYTIGVGSTGPVPFPDNFGRVILTEMNIDEPTMKEIAAITNGQYFRAKDPESLKDIYSKIDSLEETEAGDDKALMAKTPLYRTPLFISLMILLAISIIPLMRRRDARNN